MISSHWWLVALGATSAGVLGLLWQAEASPSAYAVAGGILAAYIAVFLVLRRRAGEGDPPAIALSVATILLAGSLTAIHPNLATVQFFAYPILWVLAGGVRAALLGSLVLAGSVGVGFWVSFGADPAQLPMILGTQVLSFGFSSVMGLWISHIASLGDEKARLLDELTSVQEQLATANHDAGATAERARMSREVHDTVAQSLTGLVMLAQRARRGFAAGTLDADTLELIETSARDALAETRAIVASSAPVELASGGLPDALARLAERFERETRIRVTVDAEAVAGLGRDAEVVLLRCAQEALANIRKHSRAASARVELGASGAAARLRVVDDGRGFPDDAPAGFGLAGLRDRLALIGGALEIESAPGRTVLTATLPIGDDA